MRRRPPRWLTPSTALLLLLGLATESTHALGSARSSVRRPPVRSVLSSSDAAIRQRARLPVAVLNGGEDWSIALRRKFYTTFAPVDRGDFRWEFLVPFNNKTLTTLDKAIVCSAFIGASFTLQTLTDPGASVGVHLSYIAQFFSYAMGDPIGFRSLAVLTAVLEIGGNVFEQKEAGAIAAGGVDFDLKTAMESLNDEDVFPIFYDQLFIVINAYYILRWALSREYVTSALELDADEESLYSNCFAALGFRKSQFSRLLRSATFKVAGENDLLTVQGEPIYKLYVPISGGVEVRVDGAKTTTLPPFKLVGEASLLENLQSPGGTLHPPSRATIVAPPGTSYVVWEQSAFYELQQEEDSDFAYAIQLMISRTLSEKLNSARKSQRAALGASKLNEAARDRVAAALANVGKKGAKKGATDLLQSTAAPPSTAAAAPPPVDAAAAEVQALLDRSSRYEKRIVSLEDGLEQRERELRTLKAINVYSVVLAVLGLGGAFNNIPGLQNLPKISIGVVPEWLDLPPFL